MFLLYATSAEWFSKIIKHPRGCILNSSRWMINTFLYAKKSTLMMAG